MGDIFVLLLGAGLASIEDDWANPVTSRAAVRVLALPSGAVPPD